MSLSVSQVLANSDQARQSDSGVSSNVTATRAATLHRNLKTLQSAVAGSLVPGTAVNYNGGSMLGCIQKLTAEDAVSTNTCGCGVTDLSTASGGTTRRSASGTSTYTHARTHACTHTALTYAPAPLRPSYGDRDIWRY